jgi:predicted PurR-regulated permease PerM
MTPASTLPRKAGTVAFVTLLVLSAFLLLGYAAHFFFLLFGGILFGVLLSAFSHFIENKTRIGYSPSLGIAGFLLVAVIGGSVWLMAPSVSQQADELSKTLPQALQRVESSLRQYGWGRRLVEEFNQNAQNLFSPKGNTLSKITGFFSSTLGAIANFLIVLITGVFLAADPKVYKEGFARLFKPAFRGRLLEVLDQCYFTLKNWILARSLSMLAVGVGTAIGLTLLGIPLPFVLAVIAAVLNLIPNIGPYIALIPALLMGYLQGPDQALYVFLLYAGVQAVESYVLTPMLNKRLVSTPPALLLFGQILFGILVGGIGLFLASPLIAVLIVLVNELYVKDFLEQSSKTEAEPISAVPPPENVRQENIFHAGSGTLKPKRGNSA